MQISQDIIRALRTVGAHPQDAIFRHCWSSSASLARCSPPRHSLQGKLACRSITLASSPVRLYATRRDFGSRWKFPDARVRWAKGVQRSRGERVFMTPPMRLLVSALFLSVLATKAALPARRKCLKGVKEHGRQERLPISMNEAVIAPRSARACNASPATGRRRCS